MIRTAYRSLLGRRGLGYHVSPADSRDHVRLSLAAKGAARPIPDSVDHGHHVAIRNQGATSSCVAHAVDSAIQVACGTKQGPADREYTPRSVLDIYWHARALAGMQSRDEGSYLRDGLRTVTHRGAASEAVWPLRIATVNRQPAGPNVYRTAHPWRGVGWTTPAGGQIVRMADAREALAVGDAPVFGIVVDEAFLKDDGPDVITSIGSGVGGHAMALVGYDAIKRRFRLANSWGVGWRDGGFCWIDDDLIAARAELRIVEGWS